MPDYEGLVESVKENWVALVVIRPDNQCIPGAPGVSKRVCHCASDGSTLRIEALNSVNARAGDWVSVRQEPGTLMKNAAILLGIPMLGLILGVAVAIVLTQVFTAQETAVGISVAVGLLLGIIVGVMAFRRVSSDNQPVIERICSQVETASSFDRCPVPVQNGDRDCGGCA
ncbi:MAG: SoxR reducing system RseC family protein [Pseudomonadota bacterium]